MTPGDRAAAGAGRGTAPATDVLAPTPEVLAPAQTDWLRHTLTVRGRLR